jgi:hypothetical protein
VRLNGEGFRSLLGGVFTVMGKGPIWWSNEPTANSTIPTLSIFFVAVH